MLQSTIVHPVALPFIHKIQRTSNSPAKPIKSNILVNPPIHPIDYPPYPMDNEKLNETQLCEPTIRLVRTQPYYPSASTLCATSTQPHVPPF